MKLSSLTPRNVLHAAKMTLVIPEALAARCFRAAPWIVTERPDQARDNGYCFYRYLRETHPEQPAYYVIRRDSKDQEKLTALGNVIDFDSWRHYFYFCFSKIHISAHTGGCNPSGNPFARYVKKLLGHTEVFLPHGVSYGVSEFCLAKYGVIDLFITSGKPEYDNVLAHYGYRPDQVAYTGFPRLDGWHHIKVNPKQIVLMPTWRMYLAQNPDTVFEETDYYRTYQGLLDSSALARLLDEYDLRLVFYPHNDMCKYIASFHTDCPRIEIAERDEQYDIQELLKSAALLITDYSSVHFDFAYMGKPVLYYQFDREEFWKKQYSQTDFDAAKDGFGPVAYDLSTLLENLQAAVKNGLKIEDKYYSRMRRFYEFYDEHNCDRVYEAIRGRLPDNANM